MVLSDLWSLFEESGESRLSTVDILKALNEMEDRPWPEWRRGKEISGTSLSRLLKPFKIKPVTIRFGSGTAKGYERADLADAYQRFVKAPNASTSLSSPESSRNTVTNQQNQRLRQNPSVTRKSECYGSNSANPLNNNNCYGVTDENPGSRQDARVSNEIAGGDDPVADDWGNEL